MKKNEIHYRRPCNNQRLFKPNQTVSLRAILNRAMSGLPINAKIARHEPLPPDGDNMEDFTTGTEQILDLVDAQEISETIAQRYADAEKKQREAQEKRRKEEYEAAIEKRAAELAQQRSTSNEA